MEVPDILKQIVVSYIFTNILPKVFDNMRFRTVRWYILKLNPCRNKLLNELIYPDRMVVLYIIKQEDNLLVNITLSQLVFKNLRSS